MEQKNFFPANVKYDLTFAKEIFRLENGSHIKRCMNCGMCATACATRETMDYSPRRIFNLLLLGKKETVMTSNTIWQCTSCCSCKARCPRGIPIIDVMHDLKKYAIEHGYTDYPNVAAYKAFWSDMTSRGRNFQSGFMARYFLNRGLDEMMQSIEMKNVGLDMLKRGLMPLLPAKKIKGHGAFKKILAKARELESQEVRR
ncbi:MAG: 4Fe-4S dicluster domain-containing protein [Firmicutes bacterium]|nr:4Fe-4S dicluster domain-containing protein [Bacillota bacterium]